MTSARVSYEFPCELSEKQIEADFAAWLGHISTFLGEYRLLDVDEQKTGADKQLNHEGLAYYFQFKKPTALRPLTKSTTPTRREDSRRTIQRYRHENGLEQTPHSVCFQLRAKAANAVDFQHNILKKLDASEGSRGLYVCPTEFTANGYLSALRRDQFEWLYWDRRGRWLIEAGSQHVVRAAETSAFLRGHAAIQPHIAVTNHKHHYSFSAQATDIVFHSPEFVAPGPSRLSDFVVAEIRRRQGEERWTSIDELAASRAQLAREFGIDEPQGETATERLRAFGRALHQQHQIRQVLLLRRAERGNKQ